MVKCVVSGCPNRTVSSSRGVFQRARKRFFSFPADRARVKVWLAALREADRDDFGEQLLICEDHFLPEDISTNGVSSDAIPLMPPYLDGPVSGWGAESSEEEEHWATRGCRDDEDGDGEDAPAALTRPQQVPGRGSQNPPEAQKMSASFGQRKESSTVTRSSAGQGDKRPQLEAAVDDPAVKGTSADVPLDLLTRRFLELLLAAPDGSLDLRQAAVSLQTPLQRVHNITRILCDISLIQQESKNRIKWIGWCSISNFLWRSRKKFQGELQKLKLVEDALDCLIKRCAQQLFDLTDSVENSSWAYVTLEDISRLGAFQDQTAIIIKAPEETRLQIPTPSEDSIKISLEAVKGPIMVVTCEVGSGDTVTSDLTQRRSFLTLNESRVRTTTVHKGSQGAMQRT